MARRLIQAATDAGDTTMPSAVNIARAIARWEQRVSGPSERYRLY